MPEWWDGLSNRSGCMLFKVVRECLGICQRQTWKNLYSGLEEVTVISKKVYWQVYMSCSTQTSAFQQIIILQKVCLIQLRQSPFPPTPTGFQHQSPSLCQRCQQLQELQRVALLVCFAGRRCALLILRHQATQLGADSSISRSPSRTYLLHVRQSRAVEHCT